MNATLERLFSSFVTAVVLLLLYASGLAVATFIEKYHGSAAAKAMIYYSPLFFLLQFLLVVNFLVIAFKHQYLRLRRWGLLLVHASFIIILLGALVSFLFGEEGILHIREGESTDQMAVREGFDIKGKTVAVSGFGNVAWGAAKKATELGDKNRPA